jgi:ABC-2 type transport system permease protein
MKRSILNLLVFCGILILLNVVASLWYGHLDLTEEKRFTLTKPTRELLKKVDDPVVVRVLLEGEFPAGFKRLKNATRELLEDFRSINGMLEYTFEDPNEGTVDEINERRKNLANQGLKPVNLRVKDKEGSSEKLIYPYALVSYKNKTIPINLLESEVPGVSSEVILNNSISLLEYKFSNAIQKAARQYKLPAILFTQGHGELEPLQTKDIEVTLMPFYNTGRVNLDSVFSLNPAEVAVLIVAKPRAEFSERDKFIMDQYVMKGGKMLWLIDRLNVNLDSLLGKKQFVPIDYQLNIEDLLFKYGVRIQPNLVLDLQCSRIPQVIGQQGNNPQIELFNYYYHPVIVPRINHPIVKSLEGINLLYPSSIDTLPTGDKLKKTILLASSEYSRVQFSPVRLDFEILKYEPQPEKFDKPYQPVAVLVEGAFPSMYKNRVTPDMLEGLKQLGETFRTESNPTKMIVVSDGDIAKNLIDPERKAYQPLGFNPYERYKFANKDFLVNAIEYLVDENGVIEARGKEVKLRLLNTVNAQEQKVLWQVVNILAPLLALIAFGLIFNILRKRKYAR